MSGVLEKIFYYILDFISPHDKRLVKLLSLSAFELRRQLPKPRSIDSPNVEALFDYRDEKVRTIIWAIKYKANMDVIKRVAHYLYDEILEFASDNSLFDGNVDGDRPLVVVPIPISAKRRRDRGWSQCELLCREFAKFCDDSISVNFGLLKKIKETKRQTDLSRQERLRNVRGSMEVSFMPYTDSTFIVIDDVYTTGATFEEAVRALQEAGASRVVGFFVAH